MFPSSLITPFSGMPCCRFFVYTFLSLLTISVYHVTTRRPELQVLVFSLTFILAGIGISGLMSSNSSTSTPWNVSLLYVVILATLLISLGDLVPCTTGHIAQEGTLSRKQETALHFSLAFFVLSEIEWWRMKVKDSKTIASREAITVVSMDLAELPKTPGIEGIPFWKKQLYDLWHTLPVMLATIAFYVALMVPQYLIKKVLNPGKDTKWIDLTVGKDVMFTEKKGVGLGWLVGIWFLGRWVRLLVRLIGDSLVMMWRM